MIAVTNHFTGNEATSGEVIDLPEGKDAQTGQPFSTTVTESLITGWSQKNARNFDG